MKLFYFHETFIISLFIHTLSCHMYLIYIKLL
jgi:hypothetical protein